MKIHNVEQGSDAWLELRENYCTASELPNVMGVGFIKRDEFVKQVALGIKPEYNEFMQQKFEEGHIAEEKARMLLEFIDGVDEEFTPCVGTLEDEGLLASFDGINADGTIIWEHKLWNKTLPDQVKKGKIPAKYEWQLEQQLYVSKAEKAIFMVSDGTPDNLVWCEYKPKKGRAKRLLEAWAEFFEDVRAYAGEPNAPIDAKPEKEKPPEVIVEREKRDTMPAIKFKMDGMVLISNLDGYIEAANELVKKSEIRIETDEDFANCEAATKQLKKAEDYIKKIKADVLAEVTSIDEFNKALDTIAASIRQARINGENQVKNRKDEIRKEIINAATGKLREYVNELSIELDELGVSMPMPAHDFSNAIKGKKTIETVKQAASEHLEECLQQADEIAETIKNNVSVYLKHAKEYEALFPDLENLIQNECKTFEALVKGRISDFKIQEMERIKERERLEREELERAAQAKQIETPITIDDFPVSEPKEESFADLEVSPTNETVQKPNVTIADEIREHRYKVHAAIKAMFVAYGVKESTAIDLIKAISNGEIPRINIDYSRG